MKSNHLISRSMKISDLDFDKFYNEISYDWEMKARKLQARRWRCMNGKSKIEDHLYSKIEGKNL